VREFLEGLFPERQLIYRSRGRVRHASLSRPVQIAMSLGTISFLLWVAFASAQLIFRDRVIALKNLRISEMEAGYKSLAADLDNAQTRFTTVTSELENKHEHLVAVLRQRELLEEKLGAVNSDLESVTAERDLAANLRDRLSSRLAAIETALGGAVDDKSSLRTALRNTQEWLDTLTEQRVSALRAQERLSSRVVSLEERLARIKVAQQELIDRVQQRTQGALTELETTIALTGLDLATLFEDSFGASRRQGGPFYGPDAITGAGVFPGMDGRFESSVLELENHLVRWSDLRSVLERLPLVAPVDSYSIASGFGNRRDPINGRRAIHYGIDFAGIFKTTIRSPAAGTVVFVGRKGPYGKTVEIEHGLGVKTRYGHLHRILVEKGESVAFRQKIGLMGSTGRSTGSHVHYEIHFRGKPQNPNKFLEAGRYVFKNQAQIER
jgi:murein DD-endopeptidase MepM/ murein hydrolase activator NlpD